MQPTLFLQQVDRIGAVLNLNVPAIVDLESLQALAPATLGRTLAEFLAQHHLSPFTTGPRRKQLHDGVHVLTGYGTDPIGEAEVQAFLLGAKFRLAHLVLGLGILSRLHKAVPSIAVQHRLWKAYQRGQASTFDVETWTPEQQWHLPLKQVQALFRL
jgi:ubiquinone biosynthesis protein COQ4